MSVIAAQLDPDEEGKNRFFVGTRCYYACVCVAAHAGWSRDFGPLHPSSPLLEHKVIRFSCVCNVQAVRVLEIYRRQPTG